MISVRRFFSTFTLSTRSFHIVMVGLDNAGKTSILYKAKLKETLSTISTTSFNVETVRATKDIRFKIWDIGGRYSNRPLWKTYIRHTDGLVFVIDSSDEERIDEAREELFNLLNADEIRGAPILIVATKQDVAGALTPGEVTHRLALHNISAHHQWHLQPASALLGDGFIEGLRILADMIAQWKSGKTITRTLRRTNRRISRSTTL